MTPCGADWASRFPVNRSSRFGRIQVTCDPVSTTAVLTNLHGKSPWRPRADIWASCLLGVLDSLFSFLPSTRTGGNLTTDAHLAVLAVERGYVLYSTDADFARFSGLRWVNPCAQ